MVGVVGIVVISAVATKAFIARLVRSKLDLLCLEGGDEELKASHEEGEIQCSGLGAPNIDS